MRRYAEFVAPDGGIVLVELEPGEAPPSPGVAKGGLTDRAQGLVAGAHAAFEEALQRAVRVNAQAVIGAVRALPHPPHEVEVAFGLKVAGEAGSFAVCKAGGEATYAVKLTWRSGERAGGPGGS